MRIILSTWARFHLFHLARELARRGMLERVFSTYPRFKLRDEGIAPDRLFTDPAIELLLRAKERAGLRWPAVDRRLEHAKVLAFDRFVRRHWVRPDVYIALSGSGGVNGPRAQAEGAAYICDRGSTHILHADEMMQAECARYGQRFRPSYAPFVERELREYEAADLLVVPSSFVADTFVRRGVPRTKLFVNPYGASLDRFTRVADPDPARFTVLSVGGARLRKGFGDLLDAFARLSHPGKRLVVVGDVLPEVKPLLAAYASDDVILHGPVPHARLNELYSRADVLVLPSLEEGLALVQAEALACGCPVIATPNAGAEDLFEDGVQGFIVAPRDPAAIARRLQQLADTPDLGPTLGAAGRERIKRIGGWDNYSDRYIERCRTLIQTPALAA